LKYKVRNNKKTKLSNKKQKNTWSTVPCTCIHVWFSPQCCHRQLKYFTDIQVLICKFSRWKFHGDFMTYHGHFTVKKHWPRWFLAKTRCACCIQIHWDLWTKINTITYLKWICSIRIKSTKISVLRLIQ
jgi:hypothetical protein